MENSRRKTIIAASIHLIVASIGLAGLLSPQRGTRGTVILILLIWLAALVIFIHTQRSATLPDFLGNLDFNPLRVSLLLILAIALIIMIGILVPVYQLPPLWSFVPFLLFYPFSLIYLMVAAAPDNAHAARIFANLFMLFVSVLIALVLLEVLIRSAASFLPRDIVRFAPPAMFDMPPETFLPLAYHLQDGNAVVQITWNSQADGSLPLISCFNYPDDYQPDRVPLDYTRDYAGFRNAIPWPDDVHLIVLGDSFTDATFVPSPYWDGLSANQLILAYPGTGTIDQRFLFQVYGRDRRPEVVVLAFFEGNDGFDNNIRAAWLEQNERRSYTVLELTLTLNVLRRSIHRITSLTLAAERADDCIYPVTDTYGNSVGLYEAHLGAIALDQATLQDSGVFESTIEALTGLAQDAQDAGAEFVVVYVPTKAHVHWDGLVAAGIADQITGSAEVTQQISANQSGQSDVIAQLAAEHDFLFLNLTPYFKDAATEGRALYCYTDEHICQPGHDFIREIIRSFLNEHDLRP